MSAAPATPEPRVLRGELVAVPCGECASNVLVAEAAYDPARGEWCHSTCIQARYRRRREAAATHCRHGHAWTPENTYRFPRGRRRRACRACGRQRARGGG